ncbi:MAG: hypothetical protein KGS48_12590 [Bacteroidetes bacterium]|nr:hypothetical protein [Bacteroidota bacterium]
MKYFLFLLFVCNWIEPICAQKNADCSSAMEICKKQNYNIDHTGGEGANRKEADFVACFMNGENFGQAEENSTWIKFEVKQSGSLTFVITPQNPTDDIDFVVFKLPSNGNCDQKQIVRCMAAGDQEAEAGKSPCMGKTGLRAGEKDTSEDAGCGDPDDNTWLAPLKVAKGEKYVILVSNVSSAGPGFSINFGGTAKLPCDEEPKAQPDKNPVKEPTKPIIKPAPPIVNTLPNNPTPPPTAIRDRPVKVVETVKVKSAEIDVRVWDNQVEDGDVISFYLDDKKVISNIRLTKKPQEFLIKMENKVAYLTLYAEDFGLAEPNTSAVTIRDGKSEQTIFLKAGRGFQESVRVEVE